MRGESSTPTEKRLCVPEVCVSPKLMGTMKWVHLTDISVIGSVFGLSFGSGLGGMSYAKRFVFFGVYSIWVIMNRRLVGTLDSRQC